MQRAFVVGYLQDEPRVVPGREGTADSLRLRLRCRTTRYSREGDVHHSDTWITVSVYGRHVEPLRTTLRPGDIVAVTGRATFNRFRGRDGQQRADFSIVADEVERLVPDGADVRESRTARDHRRERDMRGGRGRYVPGDEEDDVPW